MMTNLNQAPTRIVLADDHAILREGLRALLAGATDIALVGEAASGEEAGQVLQSERFDVAFIDVQMPGSDGFEALRQVVAGVRDYGNRMGIPTIAGAVYFDDRYVGNPLVFCGCVGLLPRDLVHGQARPGDRIITKGDLHYFRAKGLAA